MYFKNVVSKMATILPQMKLCDYWMAGHGLVAEIPTNSKLENFEKIASSYFCGSATVLMFNDTCQKMVILIILE